MCRFIAFVGHSICMSELVTQPIHSLINQSYHATERKEPLNGDGFGVCWYHPELSHRPVLFREVTPAWNNENLKEIARVTHSPCILGHVRAASPDSGVYYLNCHPFVHEEHAFMHNGYLAQFRSWRRKLLADLSDGAFNSIRGSTDSEHAFALFLDIHRALDNDLESSQRMAAALKLTIEYLERIKTEAGVDEPSYMNFVVADGRSVVAARYASPGHEGASLHCTTGHQLRCEEGHFRHEEGSEEDFTIVASEATTPGFCWQDVPNNHLLVAQRGGKIRFQSLED